MRISLYRDKRSILIIEKGPEGHIPTCYKWPDDFCLLLCEAYVCIFSRISSKTAFVIGKVIFIKNK